MHYKRYVSIILLLTLLVSPVIYFKFFAPKINLSDYPETIYYDNLSEYEIEIVNKIFEAVRNQETIVETSLSDDGILNIATYLLLYYGSRYDHFYFKYGPESKTLYLNLDIFEQAEEEKTIVDTRIEETLYNFYEGSDAFKLWQIANYLSDRITYEAGQTNILQGLNGSGNCQAYTRLFYKMATRLGIKVYYCSNGEHCWNMVELNGKQYFYDVTWYDTNIPDYRYIHHDNAWGREFEFSIGGG